MAYLVWGKAQQLIFADDHEYYQALGSLCRPGAYTITFETNSHTESWGDAFRIKCLMDDNHTPDAFIRAMKTARRINCNDYVQYLYECHDFDFDVANKVLNGSYPKVIRTVPTSFHTDFENGFNLRFTRYAIEFAKKTGTKAPVSKSTSGTGSSQKPRNFMNIKKGDIVVHKKYGEGKMTKIKDGLIYIKFKDGEHSFGYPAGFTNGFLEMK